MYDIKIMGRPIVAIVGCPNVGKSTLFNRLVGRRKAIVDSTPGVTRDRICANIEWDSTPITLVDTGGFLSEEGDAILNQVLSQTKEAIEEADVIIFLGDSRIGPTPLDVELVDLLRKAKKPVLFAINKIDDEKHLSKIYDFYGLGIEEALPISALHGRGIDKLMSKVIGLLPQKLPLEEEKETIKISIIGRPNVGKSSLYNYILGYRRSIVSEIPGTTRDSIDTLFHFEGKDYLLIDTAGLRRKARIKSKLERYSIVRALKDINQSDVVILLISAQEGITHQDCQIISHAEKQGKCIILAINKWDLMPKGNQFKREYIKAVQNRLIFASFIPILTISALTGMGIDEIFPLVNKLYKAYTRRIPTAKINRFIEEITEEYQPPLSNNKRAKFYYTTQAQIKPPTFIIFTNYPDNIPDSYKRFLINRIRAGLSFHHVPIRLILRRKR